MTKEMKTMITIKIRITESQYKLLTEKHSNEDIKSYLEEKYPNISNLEVRRSKSLKGVVHKYYDPKTEKVLFYVNSSSVKGWESSVGLVNKNPFTRLFVDIYLYKYLKNFSYDFEYVLLKWFNKTYGENADTVIKGNNQL